MVGSMDHSTVRRDTLERLRQVRAEYGWAGLVRRAASRFGSDLQMVWRRLAQNRNHIFVHDPDAPRVHGPVGLQVSRYTRLEDIPPSVAGELQAMGGSGTLETERWELEHHAVLWIGMLEERVVATSMTRRGWHYRKWFVPLADDDVVIFRNATARQFRGMGICPALMQRIMQDELEKGARAYVDCRVYNQPSIRSIRKAGFRRIATMKPLRLREQFEWKRNLPATATWRP